MPAFHFKMQNILNIKEKLEAQQKIEYARANAMLIEEQDKLSRLIIRRQEYNDQLKEKQKGNLDIKEINFLKNAVEQVGNMMKEQMKLVDIAQRRLELERQKLDKAMQERKTYEKLKERAFDEFKADIIYKEGKETDELVAYTYHDNGKELD
jgi:flagellar protein FliJ